MYIFLNIYKYVIYISTYVSIDNSKKGGTPE